MLSPSRTFKTFCSMFTVPCSLLAFGQILLFGVTLTFAADAAPDVKSAEQNSKTTAPAEPKVPEKIRTLMQDRDYPGAVAALDEAIKGLKPADKGGDYLTYLKGCSMKICLQVVCALTIFIVGIVAGVNLHHFSGTSPTPPHDSADVARLFSVRPIVPPSDSHSGSVRLSAGS